MSQHTVWGAQYDDEEDRTDKLTEAFRRLAEGSGQSEELSPEAVKAAGVLRRVHIREPLITAVVRGVTEQLGNKFEGYGVAVGEKAVKAQPTGVYEPLLTYSVRLDAGRASMVSMKSLLGRYYDPVGDETEPDGQGGYVVKSHWRTFLDSRAGGEEFEFVVAMQIV